MANYCTSTNHAAGPFADGTNAEDRFMGFLILLAERVKRFDWTERSCSPQSLVRRAAETRVCPGKSTFTYTIQTKWRDR